MGEEPTNIEENNNNNFIHWLEILFKIFSIIGIFVLFWYAVETYKIRKTSENQLVISARPYIAFLADTNPYTLVNKSNNVAQNIFQISKWNGQYFISDEESIGGLGTDGQKHFDRNKNKLITSNELRRRIPSITKLIDYLDQKQVNCLVAVYDDLFGNKLFSAFYGSGNAFDDSSETKYIKDL
jgi:hypothetical protein